MAIGGTPDGTEFQLQSLLVMIAYAKGYAMFMQSLVDLGEDEIDGWAVAQVVRVGSREEMATQDAGAFVLSLRTTDSFCF